MTSGILVAVTLVAAFLMSLLVGMLGRNDEGPSSCELDTGWEAVRRSVPARLDTGAAPDLAPFLASVVLLVVAPDRERSRSRKLGSEVSGEGSASSLAIR